MERSALNFTEARGGAIRWDLVLDLVTADPQFEFLDDAEVVHL